jgi:hypothetical protein|tara:strand:- start:711 stop:836 length:126 start_codon:yes stop_codon:yes gene_type:complete
MDGFITDEVTKVIGDGIVTYYKNGIYINYKTIESNEYTRET